MLGATECQFRLKSYRVHSKNFGCLRFGGLVVSVNCTIQTNIVESFMITFKSIMTKIAIINLTFQLFTFTAILVQKLVTTE